MSGYDRSSSGGRQVDLGLDGKRILVGGASRGLGAAIAAAVTAEGARVAAVARESDALRDVAARIARLLDKFAALAGSRADAPSLAATVLGLDAEESLGTLLNALGRGNPTP